MTNRIDVTVAAVVEQDDRYLIVEEQAAGEIVFNQPAGHLEPGETLIHAVIRETLEETGYRFEPQALLGLYLWHNAANDLTLLRVGFTGTAAAPRRSPTLDEGIIAAHWLTRNQLLSHHAQLRSPLVLRCIDDHRAGIRFPLDALHNLDGLTDTSRIRSA